VKEWSTMRDKFNKIKNVASLDAKDGFSTS